MGVGVYRDEHGKTPVMQAVRLAEAKVAQEQTTKSYVSTAGNAAFNAAISELVLGVGHPAATSGRAVTLQTPGGCGALRLAGDLIHLSNPKAVMALSSPTWPNHPALIKGALIATVDYPYYDREHNRLRFAPMLESIEALPAGSVVLLQPSCHNPSGEDLSGTQWDELASVLQRRGLVPLLDLAYQGLGDGLDEDAFAVRRLAARLEQVVITVSCSKNFGLYRERTGAVIYVGRTPGEVHAVHTNLMMLARRMYSMPPDHGAAVVAAVWGDEALRGVWRGELDAMRNRLHRLRHALAAALSERVAGRDFGFIARQRGMFSLLGVSPTGVELLRTKHHVYCAPDGRTNIAGLNDSAIDYLAKGVSEVIGAGG